MPTVRRVVTLYFTSVSSCLYNAVSARAVPIGRLLWWVLLLVSVVMLLGLMVSVWLTGVAVERLLISSPGVSVHKG